MVELAVVLVIVGLMLGGLLIPLSAQMEQKRRDETKMVLNEARDALMGYAVANKHLPCPDVAAIPTGIEGARDAVTHECPAGAVEGVLPWRTLGIRGLDAWERYIRYRVSPAFTNDTTPFVLTSNGGVTVNGVAVILTGSAVAVLVSHGPNGFGAKNTVQATPDNDLPAPAGADEQVNTDLNATFISHAPTPQGSANEFDDMVEWVPTTTLIYRMVAAGQLP